MPSEILALYEEFCTMIADIRLASGLPADARMVWEEAREAWKSWAAEMEESAWR
jgi:hypothetical protein